MVFSPIFSLFLSYFIREPNCILDTLWMQFVDQRCLLWAAHTAELIQGWPQSWICTASCPRTNHTDCPLIPTGNLQIDARGQDFCFDLFHYFIHEGAVSKVIYHRNLLMTNLIFNKFEINLIRKMSISFCKHIFLVAVAIFCVSEWEKFGIISYFCNWTVYGKHYMRQCSIVRLVGRLENYLWSYIEY